MSALLRLKIEHDQDAMNPRVDHDNADIMFCKHRRYNLGDEGAYATSESIEVPAALAAHGEALYALLEEVARAAVELP